MRLIVGHLWKLGWGVLILLLVCLLSRRCGLSAWNNLLAFLLGQPYNGVLLLLLFFAVVLLVGSVLFLLSALSPLKGEVEPTSILQPSDGMRIQQENQQKIAHLTQLLKEGENKPTSRKPGNTLNEMNLDMEA
jgi:hypothetical protein